MGERRLGSFGALLQPPPREAWKMPVGAVAPPSEKFLAVPTSVQDQGSIGSCTGQAFGRAIEIIDGRGIEISALGLYFVFRGFSGFMPGQDSGAFPQSSVEALLKIGAGSAALWPYDVSRFSDTPPARWFQQAADHRATAYYRARQVQQAKQAISDGLPVVVAFEVPPGFEESGRTGIWNDSGGPALGGHMVCAYGYTPEGISILNSWGSNWGDDGSFFVPWEVYVGPRFHDSIVISKWDGVVD